MKLYYGFILIISVSICVVHSQGNPKSLDTPLLSDHYVKFAPNNNLIWFGNNGEQSFDPIQKIGGWHWKEWKTNYICFTTGCVFGGFVNGDLRIGGSTYRHGLKGGRINADGKASDSLDPRYRIYHIRKEDALTGLNPDYNNYPASDGAPIDRNGKPVFFGDEQLWFVSHDLDSIRTTSLYGSKPIGLEVQTLVWAFNKQPSLADVVFIKHLLINKSSIDLDSAFIGLWADHDIGVYYNFAGVDTMLRISYGYAADSKHAPLRNAPSAGMMFLKTPIVPSMKDTVNFNGYRKAGFKQCNLSGHLRSINGSSRWGDPSFGGKTEMYNWLNGIHFKGEIPFDPIRKIETRFCVPGDPVMQKGWIDGLEVMPGQRRSFLSAGPFAIAKGDTQEVVYAMLVREGRHRLESVQNLLEYAENIQSWYHSRFSLPAIPKIDVTVQYPALNTVKLNVDVIDSSAVVTRALILDGRRNLVAEIPLHDDGMHGDGSAGDHRFSSGWNSTVRREGVDVYIEAIYPDGSASRWFGKKCIPLCGDVRIVAAHIESDHINQDRLANPGEQIRITLSVRNDTPFSLDSVTCIRMDSLFDMREKYRPFSPIPPNATVRRPYSNGIAGGFVTVDIPLSSKSGDTVHVPFIIRDTMNNCWEDRISIPVYERTIFSYDSLLEHIAGNCTGTLGYRMLDTTQWLGHSYIITVQDVDSVHKRLGVRDVDRNLVYPYSDRLPDLFAHDMQTIDGFRITAGTVNTDSSYIFYSHVYKGKPWIEYSPSNHFWFNYWYESPIKTKLTVYDLVPVNLYFSKTKTQKAYVYLRSGTPNYGYIGLGEVPFQAFDMRDTAKPRQLNVAFVEQQGSPAQDMKWNPTTRIEDREYLIIFRSSYSPSPNIAYTDKRIIPDGAQMDILYSICPLRTDSTRSYYDGDTVGFRAEVPISARDTFLLKIDQFPLPPKKAIPSNVFLSNIFPNPVTTSTTIEFGIPEAGQIAVSIFNALGKNISTLRTGWHEAGTYSVQWTPASSGSSGLYFCRLDWRGKSMWKKILLLKRCA